MRLAFIVGLVPILLTTSCIMPRPWKTAAYPPCDTLAEAPPADARLLMTLRLPRCDNGVILTSYRSSEPVYAAARGSAVTLHRAEAWHSELLRRARATGKPPVMFIHGYNTDNWEALQRADKIAWALKDQHPVVALTWPSYDRKRSFFWDEANAEWALGGARNAVSQLVKRYPGSVLVAHSMGNRLALASMAHLKATNQTAGLGRLIMAAPDVDRAVAAQAFNEGLGTNVTVYVSLRDQPLSGSWRGHGYPRAGDFSWWVSGRQPYYAFAWLPRVEVIDTTGVDKSLSGHSAFINTPEGAADLCRVIAGQGATRPGLNRQPDKPTNYGHLVRNGAQDACTWAAPPPTRGSIFR